ncbi:MAG: citrate lyase subunit alpha [Thermoplasmata archaeon]|nr:citrate lyase subunit alpha [Thermoplasmata archaeon]
MPRKGKLVKRDELVLNSVGRPVPTALPQGREVRPYSGLHTPPVKKEGIGRPLRFSTPRENKVVEGIEDAIKRVELSDGMTISFHHHLRNGDLVANTVVDAIHRMGIRDIKIFPSALFPVHEHLIPYIEDGTISWIEGSLNGPLGRFASEGGLLPHPVVLRTHGGRTRAIEAGDVVIDVAFLAASAADPAGNMTGAVGPSAFGAAGFAFADAWYARKVVVVTDNIVPYPCTPISIPSTCVDVVAKVDRIGDPEGIGWGTTQITRDPRMLMVARRVIKVLEAAGYLKNGFSFQAGAGGTSLAVVKFLGDYFKEKGLVASFAMGGTTGYVVRMLDEGTLQAILDAQAFDLKAIESLTKNPNHMEVSHHHFGNPHTGGAITHQQTACFLGATEIDVDFNVNVNTHSDGYLLHGTGGHTDAAVGSEITIITAPLIRGRIPVIRERVTTITTPGEAVDVVVTDHGVAVNPRREDLLKSLKKTDLPVVDIEDLKRKALSLVGKTIEPKLGDEVIAVVEYRTGEILDSVFRVLK